MTWVKVVVMQYDIIYSITSQTITQKGEFNIMMNVTQQFYQKSSPAVLRTI